MELVALARLRWRIERDNREGKGLAGLDYFEWRSWQGLHHHAAWSCWRNTSSSTSGWRPCRKHPCRCPFRCLRRRIRWPLLRPFPPDEPAPLPPYPQGVRSSFALAHTLQRALARLGLPCCPMRCRVNECADPFGLPDRRKLDDFTKFVGWAAEY